MGQLILGVDPGTAQSGYVWLVQGNKVHDCGVLPNATMLRVIAESGPDVLAIEMVASYGMAVGREVFETVRWIGRFQQAYRDPESVRLVYRKDVKLHLCNSPRANDSNIRQALIDKLGPIGTKNSPGPLYGVSGHAWSALAVAVTVADGA